MAVNGSAARTLSQNDVIAFLSSPDTFGGQPVDRVDTHLSHIFLAGNRAYKLKRSVTLNFVDFATAELRRTACEREVRLNKQAANDLYLGVVPIVLRQGRLNLGGDGAAVDWVVEMERFDRRLEFDRLADAGQLTEALMLDLADVVSELHLAAEPIPRFGGHSGVTATIRQIAGALRPALRGTPLQNRLTKWEERALQQADKFGRLLDRRRSHGCVRHCHGDLHLANICLHNGRPTPFDAIEFSDEMATTDLLYDIAFTVMDLLHRNQQPLANTFINRYLSATRDYSGTELLPLFISMRATVRAMANALVHDPRTELDVAERFLNRAETALSDNPAPRLIAIGGLSGSGKSTIAKAIAPHLCQGHGAIVLRTDVTRKRLFGVKPECPLPENAYHPGVSETVHRRLFKDARRALAASQTVILDGTFLRAEHRAMAARLAEQAGVTFNGIWLSANEDLLSRRIDDRQADPSDATAEVMRRQSLLDTGPMTWTETDAAGSIDGVSSAVLNALIKRD